MPDYNARQLRYKMGATLNLKTLTTFGDTEPAESQLIQEFSLWVGFLDSSGSLVEVSTQLTPVNTHRLLFRYDARLTIRHSLFYITRLDFSGQSLSLGRTYKVTAIENVEGKSRWGIATVTENTVRNNAGQGWK